MGGFLMKIGLIRHGLTEWNKKGRAQGHSDIPLCKEGRAEVDQLANRMAGEQWDVIYSSDLKRAKETAEAITKKVDIQIHSDKRLRERHGGQIEGTTEADRLKKWGDNWRALDLDIETGEEMSARGMEFLEDIIEKHRDENVLIVSHGAFLKQILRTLFPQTDVETSLKNCSVTMLETDGDRWDLTLHNCVKHM